MNALASASLGLEDAEFADVFLFYGAGRTKRAYQRSTLLCPCIISFTARG